MNQEHKDGTKPQMFGKLVFCPRADERCGYKTQKPKELIKRIICSTNEGDMVLDCFTTAIAAVESNRKFIIGDVSPVAIKVTAARLKERIGFSDFEILNFPSEQEWKDMNGHVFAEKICMFQNVTQRVMMVMVGRSIQFRLKITQKGINYIKNFVASLGKHKEGIFVAINAMTFL